MYAAPILIAASVSWDYLGCLPQTGEKEKDKMTFPTILPNALSIISNKRMCCHYYNYKV